MVKHIIIWNLKEEYNTPEIKEGIKKGLESLVGVVPGLLEVRVETNPLESSTGDVFLYSVFENEESLKGYSVHPEHVRVANTFVRPYTNGRACFDYEE
ncbi:MAG: Dabb family protein [Clostridia bacterium]|nr:Dabb family protein [Clostridia bacterium]